MLLLKMVNTISGHLSKPSITSVELTICTQTLTLFTPTKEKNMLSHAEGKTMASKHHMWPLNWWILSWNADSTGRRHVFFAVLSWNTFEAFELLFSSHIFWSKWQIEIDSCCWAWCLFITDNTIKKEKKKKKKRESEKTNTLKYKWSTNVNNSHF